MKFFLCSMLVAFLMLTISGCLNAGGKASPRNDPAAAVDLSGTYQGPDGTLVIKKVDDAHLMRSPEISGYSETVAIPVARVEKARKQQYTDTGTIAPNAYLVTSTLKKCPLKLNTIALLQDNFLSSADTDGTAFSILQRGDGSLELDFPMAMIRGRKGAENCMVMAPFAKVAQ